MQALHEAFGEKALFLWERTDPYMYCPRDLPVGRSVEEEDNNNDGTDPVQSTLTTV